jgi:hypothetical protein
MECPATITIRNDIPPDKWTTGNILKAIKKIEFLEVLPEIPTINDSQKTITQ